jgi:uncharacterized protein YndB with AHSA1/START domain
MVQERRAEFGAPRDRVWEAIIDPALPQRWNPHAPVVEQVSGRPGEVGFVMKVRRRGGRLSETHEVIEAEPPARLVILSRSPLSTTGRTERDLTPTAAGTELRIQATWRVAPLIWLLAGVLEGAYMAHGLEAERRRHVAGLSRSQRCLPRPLPKVPLPVRVVSLGHHWYVGQVCLRCRITGWTPGAFDTPDVTQHVLADFVFKRLNVIT